MTNFPHDLVFDLLSRLPVKSVQRFRCVCKSWCSLISEPQFVKAHLNRAISDVNVGCQRVLIPHYRSIISLDYEALMLLSKKKLKKARLYNGGNACTELDLPWKVYPNSRVFGSCHGMVCMVDERDKIVLYNPCTREFRELPKPTSINFESRINGGLGYDSYVDDYKFVITAYEYSDGKCWAGELKAEVFSLRSNSWRILRDIPPDILCIYGCEAGVFLNGALHWIAICKTQHIISFDLATEKFQKPLPLPPHQGDERSSSNYRNIILLGGCLSVSNTNVFEKINVWVVKEYGVEASWSKICTLDIRFHEPLQHYLWPVCLSKNGELLVDVDNEIIIYSPKYQNYRKLLCRSTRWLNHAIQYTESLVSPNGIVENN